MYIEHVALWTEDLEGMKQFYETHFGGQSTALYHNPKTGFQSYFLTFEEGCRIELMHDEAHDVVTKDTLGYGHIALAVGNKKAVDQYVQQFVAEGISVISGPRVTGDGYYEAVIQDPEGNLIELTTESE